MYLHERWSAASTSSTSYTVQRRIHQGHLAKTMRRSMRNVMAEKVWAIWTGRQKMVAQIITQYALILLKPDLP